MSNYKLHEEYNSKNFTPAAQVPATFGVDRVIQQITIHHWGGLGQDFWTVTNYLCTNNTPTSAHYVAMDGVVACIVAPANAAWHAGNAIGNGTTVGLELRPEATDGDYRTAAELIADLRAAYGDLPLVGHNHWTATSCPGAYNLARLDREARAVKAPVKAQSTSVKPIPAKKPAAKPAVKAPAPVALVNRTVTNAVAMVRTGPGTNFPAAPGYPNGLPKGTAIAVKGYVAGQDPYGTGDDAWYVTKSGFYVWANAAQNTVAGLKRL